MAERLPSVSVVMPTHNRESLLPIVVEPLLADSATTELVVVVDACVDRSLGWLRERARRDPRLRPLPADGLGPAGARRAGARAATGEVVLFLDDDVRATPGLVTGHARRHSGHDGLVVVGYTPPSPPGDRRRGDFPERLFTREYEAACREYERSPDAILDGLWGGHVSLRREDFHRAGDGPPLRYHEDRDLGLRLRRVGLRAVFDRSLRAEHLYERDVAGFVRDARAQGVGMRAIHELHADLLGPLPRDAFASGLPAPLRALVRLAGRPRGGAATAAALVQLTRAAGLVRAWETEERAGRLLRRVEQQRGAAGAA